MGSKTGNRLVSLSNILDQKCHEVLEIVIFNSQVKISNQNSFVILASQLTECFW